MDHIRKSNLAMKRFLIKKTTMLQSWLTATTYEECARSVVLSSLMKKFEEPDDTLRLERARRARDEFLLRNQNTPTNTSHHRLKLASGQDGLRKGTLMEQLRVTLKNWFRGATFSLDDGWVGPGEAFTSLFGQTSALNKFSKEIECTPESLPLVRKFFARSNCAHLFKQGWVLKVIPGNRFSTVRKTNEKDRAICMEGTGSMLIQKCLGQMFRRVYAKVFGRSLDDTQQFHREIVLAGHYRGCKVATIDLSAASDSISMLLCSWVLPPWVFRLIESCRSPFVIYEDDSGAEKADPLRIVSSMGNGFTFELLTLICAAVCSVSSCTFFSTYGDDIICDLEHADTVMENLELLGFTVNRDKTCVGKPQLESCGAFSFDGIEMLRYELEWAEHDTDVIVMMNKVRALADFYRGLVDDLFVDLDGLWAELYAINHDVVPLGPNHDSYVDGAYARVPLEKYPSVRKSLPTWAQDIASRLHYDPQKMWLIEAWEFRQELTLVHKPRNSAAYLLVRLHDHAAPTLYRRGEGEWVRKAFITDDSGMLWFTRKSWNELSPGTKEHAKSMLFSQSDVCLKGASASFANGLTKPKARPRLPHA